MSLHEGENQASGADLMLEVPGVDGKDEIVPVMDDPEHADAIQKPDVRSRKLTAKGYQFKITTLQEDVSRIYKRMMKKSSAINDLLYSTKNMVTVEEELAQFDDTFKQLMKVHDEYVSIEVNEDEKKIQNTWFEEVDDDVFAFKHKVHNWLKGAVVEEEEKASRRSAKRSSKSSKKSSKSSRSSSSTSSSKERAAVEKAKLAELMMEAEFLEKKQIVQNQAEKLKMEEKLAIARARSKVFAAMKDDNSLRGSQMSLNEDDRHESKTPIVKDDDDRKHKNIKQPSKSKHDNDQTEQIHRRHRMADINKDEHQQLRVDKKKPSRSSDDVNKMICDLLLHQSAPDVEIDTFKGDPLEYHYFMSLFTEAVEKKISDPHGRLVRLLKFTEGEAKETIKHCIQQPSKRGYERAKLLLEQHYGNPHRILAAYRREIKAWPLLKPGDPSGYKKFYNFLLKCESIMTLQQWNSLDTPEILCLLISKLPGNTRDRWNRKVLTIRRHHRREPELEDFIDFFDDENELANDPLFSREALKDYTEKWEKGGSNRRRAKPYVGKTGVEEKYGDTEGDGEIKKVQCSLCNENHDLDDCTMFTDKTVDERSKILWKKKLCYGCYSPVSQDHNAKTCKQRRTCKICKQSHPTGLHGYVPRKKPPKEPSDSKDGVPPADNKKLASNFAEMDIKCNSSSIESKIISMCVVPVKVSHSKSRKEVFTYAMLDNCSQGTFIKEEIQKRLGADGREADITIKTLNGEQSMKSTAVSGLRVSSSIDDKKMWLNLPSAYTREDIPVDVEEVATRENIKSWDHLTEIADKLPHAADIEIGLLIGADCAKALEPQEVIPGRNDGPFAYRTTLGWCVVGPLAKPGKRNSLSCHRIIVQDAISGAMSNHHFAVSNEVKDISAKEMLTAMYNADFNEEKAGKLRHGGLANIEEISFEDRKFLKMMDENSMKVGNHYQLPLPLKNESMIFPDNRHLAEKRLRYLKKRFLRNPKFYEDYWKFVDVLLVKGYARKSTNEAAKGRTWYIPHHGVYHPNKPGKIRVVFDCSAEVNGVSLNKSLMSGPDLTNQIVGVITRFREESVVIMGDIEAMFHQVLVPEKDRSLLRFLWWENHNINNKISEFEMGVHLFGGTSSPSCCNYALKRTALDNEDKYQKEVTDILRRDFYVDDLLKSVKDVNTAIYLLKEVIKLCAEGGFRLTKFVSNKVEVLQSIPEADRRDGLKNIDINSGSDLPTERALGINWDIENDKLGFKVNLGDKPYTRRGMLSMISKIYDPLGLASPFLLKGRKILQELCKNNFSWDEQVSAETIEEWEQWKNDLKQLENIKMDRCFKPPKFGRLIDCSLHHFSDASEDGYGQVSYLRLVDEEDHIHCSLVMGKSRVTPLKFVSIPRLELTAAALSIKVSLLLRKELTISTSIREFYWTDSKVVLGYIRNEAKRFKVFVANRVQTIRENSDVNNWRYIETKKNPADDASRGLSPCDSKKVIRWVNGPEFLWQEESRWPNLEDQVPDITNEDREVKAVVSVHVVNIGGDVIAELVSRISSWNKLLGVMAFVLKFVKKMKSILERSTDDKKSKNLTVEDMEYARIVVLQHYQRIEFKEVYRILDEKERYSRKLEESIGCLNPYIDVNGLVRVGGRLRQAELEEAVKHPILLPKKGHLTELIVRWCHEKTAHSGRNMTLTEIRSSGYWVMQGNSVVKWLISKCVTCRRLRGKVGEQIMADLPPDRTKEEPPFTYCGVDMFGPFEIKERRTILKRYGALFTCLASRGIHIEMTKSMETDSFILALRRFIARRGSVRSIRCDNGGNFVGAKHELARCIEEMDHNKIREFMLKQNADWIYWKMNPPLASHMGGVWERQIRSARAILSSILKTHSTSLDDESLNTLFTEVEAIVNSRPLVVETINDVNSEVVLSPTNLLTMKSKVVMPPPGEFSRPDIYCRKRWRRVQHLSNEFWSRWRKEFLLSLQERQKWSSARRNFREGDIVILKDDNCRRNEWKLAKIVETFPDEKGFVRTVKLLVSSIDRSGSMDNRMFVRPVDKMVLLVEADEVRSPTREPSS